MSRAVLVMAGLLLAAFVTSPASACDCMRYILGSPNFDRDLDRALGFATVVAEGVLVRGEGGLDPPMIFRPTRILKGPRRRNYRVHHVQYRRESVVENGCSTTISIEAPWSMCDLATIELLEKVGTPVLLVLTGGPGAYQASRCVNFQGADVDAAIVRRLTARRAR